jgi:hypothetical protein
LDPQRTIIDATGGWTLGMITIHAFRTFFEAVRLRSRRPAVLVSSVLLVFILLSLWTTFEETQTFDEVVDLPSGYLSAALGDFRMTPEHPVLLKNFSALPLLFQSISVRQGDTCIGDSQWGFGFNFFYRSGNPPRQILISGRLMALFWGILLLLSVYAASVERFGQAGGSLSLILAAFCPTLLAFSHLVMCDVTVTALIFLTFLGFQRLLDRPSLRRTVELGILLGGALLSKFSALILPILLLFVGAAEYIRRRKVGELVDWRPRVRSFFGTIVVAYVVVWAAYRFRFPATSDLQSLPWDWLPARGSTTELLVAIARRWHLLPEAFLYGLAQINRHSVEGHDTYALGNYSKMGWWWYYPFAFLVKTPASSLVLFGWSIVAGFRGSAEKRWTTAMGILPPALFGLLSLFTKIDIGIRQILPIFPFLWLLAGGLLASPQAASGAGPGKRLITGLAILGILDCLIAAPYFMPYFNMPARLAAERHQLLADSNIDMGQDLGRLKAYMERHHIPEVKLAYFGTASPGALGLKHKRLPGFELYSQSEPQWETTEELLPGDVAAISATNLVGVYLPDKRYYLKRLAHLKPVAIIGETIYVYRIPPGMPKAED